MSAIQPRTLNHHANQTTAHPVIAGNDNEGHEQRHLLPRGPTALCMVATVMPLTALL